MGVKHHGKYDGAGFKDSSKSTEKAAEEKAPYLTEKAPVMEGGVNAGNEMRLRDLSPGGISGYTDKGDQTSGLAPPNILLYRDSFTQTVHGRLEEMAKFICCIYTCDFLQRIIHLAW